MSGVCVHILYSNKGIHYCSFHILSCRLRVFGLVWLQRNKKFKAKLELIVCIKFDNGNYIFVSESIIYQHSTEVWLKGATEKEFLQTKSQHVKAETWRGKAQLIVCIKFDNWKLHLSLKKYNLPALHWSHSKEWLKRNFS